ncbi:hypothetical protein GGX14DRAFT_383942 [Mycena pura]|uniref:Uncharacterized protein n=1 Tax=Mycena pura TaxID=153505 RepID=A0AAD6YV87_9AGAR|nr:hypothetical protein GGX14DRAFT_383942 [Mycena pura]
MAPSSSTPATTPTPIAATPTPSVPSVITTPAPIAATPTPSVPSVIAGDPHHSPDFTKVAFPDLLTPYKSTPSASPASVLNDAPLDGATIAKLATSIIDASPKLTSSSAFPRATSFQARYVLQTSAKLAQQVTVDLTICADAKSAQDAMNFYLNSFTQNYKDVLKKTDRLLGQVSLQTAGSIFWVRDTVFAKVEAFTLPTAASLAPTTPPTLRSTPPATAPSKPLVDFTTALDTHLSKGAVQASAQHKPNVALKGGVTAYKVVRGKTFSVFLADAKGAHEAKPAVAADPAIVKQVKNGTADGEYVFIGAKVGKTKVKLIVARADNLAVSTVDIDVEVTKPDGYAK